MQEYERQIQNSREHDGSQAELSMLSPPDRPQPPVNSPAPIPSGPDQRGKPPLLKDVTLATSNTTVRRQVYAAYWRDENDYRAAGVRTLPERSAPLVVALFDNIERRRKLAKSRDSLEARLKRKLPKEAHPFVVITGDQKTREIERAIEAKDKIILDHLRELAWTPASAARFGLTIVRGRLSLAELMSQPTDSEV